MDEILYRPFRGRDAKDLAQIIVDTWRFDEGMNSRRQAMHMGCAYLYLCMLQADFTQVAERNGRAVGVILGRTVGRRVRPWVAWKGLYHSACLWLSGGFRVVKETYRDYDVYQEKLEDLSGVSAGKFQAELALFIVSAQLRGYGVGTELFTRLNAFFEQKNVEHYYLHTDATCSYEFYERHGLQRLAEVPTRIRYAGVSNVPMFVYGK